MDNAMQMDTLIYWLDAEGVTKTILVGALGLTFEELDDKLYRGEFFTPEEQVVIQRLGGLSDQEMRYIFGPLDECQVKSEKT